MKRALLLCMVGLLCMGAVPYAAIGWDFPGNVTVQDNVGIGTDAPVARLSIQGANVVGQVLTGTVSVSTGGMSVLGSGTIFTTELAVGDVVTIENHTYTVYMILSETQFWIEAPYYQGVPASGINVYRGDVTTPPLLTISDTTTNGAAPKVTVTNVGYVGIGTTNPQAQLEVAGSVQAQTVKVTSSLSAASVCASGVITSDSRVNGNSISIGNTALPANQNRALCWSSNGGYIGYCTTPLNSSGVCTCVAIQ